MTDRRARIIVSEYRVSVEIGDWDPDRYRKSGDDVDVAGFRFGRTAETVKMRSLRENDWSFAATVSIGGIGVHEADVAWERAETYRIAAETADLLDEVVPYIPLSRALLRRLFEERFPEIPVVE